MTRHEALLFLGIWECGHARTLKNTATVCASKPRGQCRECLRVVRRRYWLTDKSRVAEARREAVATRLIYKIDYNANNRGN